MTFWKKTCKRCKRKIEKGFSYCPHCGYSLDREKEERDYGFIGKRDSNYSDPFRNEIRMPLGFNTIFKKLMKEMDKQFKELDKEIGKENVKRTDAKPLIRKGGISINISSGAGKPVIRVKSFRNMPQFKGVGDQTISQDKPTKKKKEKPKISEEKAKKFAKLPRQEAESKVRRLSGKVIYEIDLPGVKNKKDVIVNQLENSIEIKAFSKDKAYFKFLPVNLPLKDYKLSKGKLTLELGEK
jgi:hypothetical protein